MQANVKRELCRRALGLVLPEDLPAIGLLALEQGLDSPSLRILAGLHASELEEAKSAFELSLKELGLTLPGKREAVLHLAREVAEAIVRGKVSPLRGAQEIWDLSRRGEGHLHELDTFVYAASEWQDRPEMRSEFERAILAAAEDLGAARR